VWAASRHATTTLGGCATLGTTGKGSCPNLNVKAGRQYSIIVDGANGAAGAYQLRVTPP
jgi:hypothetical protein